VSLLISSLCTKVYDPYTQQSLYIAFVTTVTFFSGILLAGLGLLRFGFLADVLSHASILGFLAGVHTQVPRTWLLPTTVASSPSIPLLLMGCTSSLVHAVVPALHHAWLMPWCLRCTVPG